MRQRGGVCRHRQAEYDTILARFGLVAVLAMLCIASGCTSPHSPQEVSTAPLPATPELMRQTQRGGSAPERWLSVLSYADRNAHHAPQPGGAARLCRLPWRQCGGVGPPVAPPRARRIPTGQTARPCAAAFPRGLAIRGEPRALLHVAEPGDNPSSSALSILAICASSRTPVPTAMQRRCSRSDEPDDDVGGVLDGGGL